MHSILFRLLLVTIEYKIICSKLRFIGWNSTLMLWRTKVEALSSALNVKNLQQNLKTVFCMIVTLLTALRFLLALEGWQ